MRPPGPVRGTGLGGASRLDAAGACVGTPTPESPGRPPTDGSVSAAAGGTRPGSAARACPAMPARARVNRRGPPRARPRAIMRCRPCAAPSGRGRLTGAAQRNANGAATPHGGIADATSADRPSAPASEPCALVGYSAARLRVAAADDIAAGDEAPRGKAGWDGTGDGAWAALPAASADTTGPATAWPAGDGRTGVGPAAVADVSAGSAEAASAEDLVGGDTAAKDRDVEDRVVEDRVIGGRVAEDSAVEEALGSGEPLPRHRWTASPDSRGGGGADHRRARAIRIPGITSAPSTQMAAVRGSR